MMRKTLGYLRRHVYRAVSPRRATRLPWVVGSVAVLIAVAGAFARPRTDEGRDAAVRRASAALALAVQEYRLAYRGTVLVERAEAEEAALFVAAARQAAASVSGDGGRALDTRLAAIGELIAGGTLPDSVAVRAAEVEDWMRGAFGVDLAERPARPPSLAEGERLYGERCAQCHGASGLGDGPAAAGLTPPPARLVDPAVLAAVTPLDVYRRISLGVPGTSMPAFGEGLTPDERWALTLRVVALGDSLVARVPQGDRALAFATARANLRSAIERASAGDRAGAGARALDAYLAFETLEPALRPTRPALVAEVERAFAAFREAAAGFAAPSDLRGRVVVLERLLARAAAALADHPSPAGLFTESALLLLREGFEAILILGAIGAVVAKAGAARRRRDVRWGAALGVLASLATAVLLDRLLRVAPSQRDALEGAVMLLAAAVLFYVSYWMVSKLDQASWQRFVHRRVEGALTRGGALALVAVAFLAVYREGFETVLFYQALYGTGGAAGAAAVTAGLVAGGALLIGGFVAMERFGVRLPLRPFFAVTGVMLYFLAVVFAGRGVTELQEGGWIGVTPLRGIPASEFLGLHPTLESLAAQGLLVAALLGAIAWMLVVRPLRERRTSGRASGPRALRATVARRFRPQEGAGSGRGAAADPRAAAPGSGSEGSGAPGRSAAD
jgi:high-affinity iron transporter